jgi:hypothetical protein
MTQITGSATPSLLEQTNVSPGPHDLQISLLVIDIQYSSAVALCVTDLYQCPCSALIASLPPTPDNPVN